MGGAWAGGVGVAVDVVMMCGGGRDDMPRGLRPGGGPREGRDGGSDDDEVRGG